MMGKRVFIEAWSLCETTFLSCFSSSETIAEEKSVSPFLLLDDCVTHTFPLFETHVTALLCHYSNETSNFFILSSSEESLLRKDQNEANNQNGQIVACQYCEVEPAQTAQHACVTCRAFYCDMCLRTTHPRKKPFINHKIVGASNFNDGTMSTITTTNTQQQQTAATTITCCNHNQVSIWKWILKIISFLFQIDPYQVLFKLQLQINRQWFMT